MSYSVITTTAARRDIQEAIDWEDERSPGLSKRFFTDLEQRFREIADVPKVGSIRYENVRCTTTKIFKYLIHYIIDDRQQTVIILRVLHIKRKPVW